MSVLLPWPQSVAIACASRLQHISSRISGYILDSLGASNFRLGRTISFTGWDYEFTDRLYGLDGISTLLLLAGSIAIICSRSFLHALALFLFAWMWLAAGYVLHCLIVVLSHQDSRHLDQIESTSFWIAIGVFAFQVAAIFISDLCLVELFRDVPDEVTSFDLELSRGSFLDCSLGRTISNLKWTRNWKQTKNPIRLSRRTNWNPRMNWRIGHSHRLIGNGTKATMRLSERKRFCFCFRFS